MQELRQEVLELETLWSVRDLSDYLEVSVNTVRAAARRGAIPGCTKERGRYVFDRDVAIAGWKPARRVVMEVSPVPVAAASAVGQTTEDYYLNTLADVVDAENWRAICDKAVEQASEGDRHARNWISDHLLGKPITRIASQSVSTQRTEFSKKDRAAVVAALLEGARNRANGSAKSEPDRKASNRRADSEQPAVDASPRERSADAGVRNGS